MASDLNSVVLQTTSEDQVLMGDAHSKDKENLSLSPQELPATDGKPSCFITEVAKKVFKAESESYANGQDSESSKDSSATSSVSDEALHSSESLVKEDPEAPKEVLKEDSSLPDRSPESMALIKDSKSNDGTEVKVAEIVKSVDVHKELVPENGESIDVIQSQPSEFDDSIIHGNNSQISEDEIDSNNPVDISSVEDHPFLKFLRTPIVELNSKEKTDLNANNEPSKDGSATQFVSDKILHSSESLVKGDSEEPKEVSEEDSTSPATSPKSMPFLPEPKEVSKEDSTSPSRRPKSIPNDRIQALVAEIAKLVDVNIELVPEDAGSTDVAQLPPRECKDSKKPPVCHSQISEEENDSNYLVEISKDAGKFEDHPYLKVLRTPIIELNSKNHAYSNTNNEDFKNSKLFPEINERMTESGRSTPYINTTAYCGGYFITTPPITTDTMFSPFEINDFDNISEDLSLTEPLHSANLNRNESSAFTNLNRKESSAFTNLNRDKSSAFTNLNRDKSLASTNLNRDESLAGEKLSRKKALDAARLSLKELLGTTILNWKESSGTGKMSQKECLGSTDLSLKELLGTEKMSQKECLGSTDLSLKESLAKYVCFLEEWVKRGLDKTSSSRKTDNLGDFISYVLKEIENLLGILKSMTSRAQTLMKAAHYLPDPGSFSLDDSKGGKNSIRTILMDCGVSVWSRLKKLEEDVAADYEEVKKMTCSKRSSDLDKREMKHQTVKASSILYSLYITIAENFSNMTSDIFQLHDSIRIFVSEIDKLL